MTKQYHKSRLESNKGYLQIDFIFATAIFFLVFFSIYSSITSQEEAQDLSISLQKLNFEARDICYLLTSSKGIPENWNSNIGTLKSPGLKNNSLEILDPNKIAVFRNISAYFPIINSLGIEEFVYLKIEDLENQTTYLEFGATRGLDSLSSTYTCYSRYNNRDVKILTEVWK